MGADKALFWTLAAMSVGAAAIAAVGVLHGPSELHSFAISQRKPAAGECLPLRLPGIVESSASYEAYVRTRCGSLVDSQQ